MTTPTTAAPGLGTADEGTDLLARVTALKPMLREESLENERIQRVPERSLAALKEAGVWKLMTPKHYGGYEAPWRTVTDVLATIVSGSTGIGWISTLTQAGWILGRCNDELQDEIFGSNPGPIIPSVFGSFGARARHVSGGVRIVGGGKWRFNSGCPNGDWDLLAAIVEEPDGSESQRWLCIPLAELEVQDDWHVSGGKGTGSMSVICGDLFVPEHRILGIRDNSIGAKGNDNIESRRQADNPYFTLPTFLQMNCLMNAIAVGAARGALEVFLEQLPGRKLTHTDYLEASQAPITHLQVGEAAAKISAIEAISARGTAMTQAWQPGDPDLTPLQMGELVTSGSLAFKLAREAVDLLFLGSGSSVILEQNPLQRYQRDIQAFNQHALQHPDTQFENYGRILCGLPPFGRAARTMPAKSANGK